MNGLSGNSASSDGAIIVNAYLATPPLPATPVKSTWIHALLYLGPTPGAIQLIALEQHPNAFQSDDGALKGAANDAARVLFKAQEKDDGDVTDNASVQTWASMGGRVVLAQAGDLVPGAPRTKFNGFSPHLDLNDDGNAAFTAGIDVFDDSPEPVLLCDSDSGSGEECRGVYFATGSGTIVEIARDTAAAAAEAGTGASSSDGFDFEVIGSVAVLDECNTVYFVAENQTLDPTCGAPGGTADFG